MGVPNLPPEAAGALPPEMAGALQQEGQNVQAPVKKEPTLTQRQRENPDDPTLSSYSEIGGAIEKANKKTRDFGKKWDKIPTEMAPRWEMLVDESAKSIKAKHDIIKVAIGEKPYNNFPLDEAEAEIRYLQMRNNLELHTEAMEANIVKTKDGRLLIKKDYLKKLIEFEKKIREGRIAI
ncbi:MAG TPA: hypothetical protein ENI23_12190 [bacterium]|nr:hypothetical protein [bacterium]